RPFSGDGAAAIAMARLTTTPPRPSALRASVPAALDQIVQRAMAFDPAQRFASAAAMARGVEGFLTAPPAAACVGAGAAAARAAAAAAAQPRPTQQIPYPPNAYARPPGPAPVTTSQGTPPPPPSADGPDDEEGGTSPWAWVAGIGG